MTKSGEDKKHSENEWEKVGKRADDDGTYTHNSLLSMTHSVYDVSGVGLVPDLRYSGEGATSATNSRVSV